MNHSISVTEAGEMTRRYRAYRETILKPEYQERSVLPLSETFEKSAITMIAAKDGCTSLRIYYGMDEDYKVHAIIVGVNEFNEDILPSASVTTTEEDDSLAERAFRCPDICPPDSPLNV